MDAVKLLGSLLGNNATGGNMLGSLLKGAMGGGGQSSGSNPMGMIAGLLGGGGGGGQASGVAGMLGSILGGGGGETQQGGGVGGMLSGLLGGGDQAQAQATAPAPAQVDQATLLIRAMCNAAKADGEVDKAEQDQILGRLGDVEQAEIDFVRNELSSPLDIQGFANSVPADMAANVYALSVMTVKVDTREEVAYLQQLAQGLNIDQQTLGQIHQQLGVA